MSFKTLMPHSLLRTLIVAYSPCCIPSLLHTLLASYPPCCIPLKGAVSLLCNFVVFVRLQVTRYEAAYGIKYVALSNYKGTIFGMFRAPHQLLLSNLIRFNDMTPSVLEVKNCCAAMPNKQQHQAVHFCVTLHLRQFVVHLSQFIHSGPLSLPTS